MVEKVEVHDVWFLWKYMILCSTFSVPSTVGSPTSAPEQGDRGCSSWGSPEVPPGELPQEDTSVGTSALQEAEGQPKQLLCFTPARVGSTSTCSSGF